MPQNAWPPAAVHSVWLSEQGVLGAGVGPDGAGGHLRVPMGQLPSAAAGKHARFTESWQTPRVVAPPVVAYPAQFAFQPLQYARVVA